MKLLGTNDRVDLRVGAVPAVAVERACLYFVGKRGGPTSCEKVLKKKVSERTHKCENNTNQPCPGLRAAVAVVRLDFFISFLIAPSHPSREA